jgi:signal transduction histidine kinase
MGGKRSHRNTYRVRFFDAVCSFPYSTPFESAIIVNNTTGSSGKEIAQMARPNFNRTHPSISRKDLEFQYSQKRRAEFFIAIGRLVLAIFSLLAIWLDPSEPGRYAQIAYALLCGYVVYSLLLTVSVLRINVSLGNLPLTTHAFDLLLFTIFMFFTEGPTSPFFVYFVFSLLCATLRWSWRGTLWTAGVALMMFVGMGIYTGEIIRDPAFELNRFIIRSVYLTLVAILLCYLGAYGDRIRGELSGLAAWPKIVHKDAQVLLREMMEYAAGILRAPRMVLAWEEKEEPWLYLASWSHNDFNYIHEPPDIFEPLVAEPLEDNNFLCLDTRMPVPTVIHTSPAGLQRWHGVPLNPDFQDRFGVRAVLSLSMEGKGLKGRLFVLDKKGITTDDLVLGGIVAHEMVIQMDYFYMLRQLQQSTAAEERIRMARDLHDGLLQSLTGAALQLETVQRLIETDTRTAQQRLLEIQHLIAAEQKDLRSQIHDLKASPLSFPGMNTDLATRLEELAELIERHWSIRVEMVKRLTPGIPYPLAQEIYSIVRESLTNAARHANASSVRAEISVNDNHVNIIVSDNGHGFRFQGRYNHATLTNLKMGPVMLKERVSSLGGSLNIESSDTGARLEITIPFTQAGD